MMMSTLALNLPYHYKLDPRATKKASCFQTFYETNIGLWKKQLNSTTRESYRIIDNLPKIVTTIDEINSNQNRNQNQSRSQNRNRNRDRDQYDGNYVKYVNTSINNQLITVFIHSNSFSFIEETKSQILRAYDVIISKTIVIDEIKFMKIDETFIAEMNKLCQRYQVEVIINNTPQSFDTKPVETAYSYSYSYSIHMVGGQDNVTQFETSLKAMIDSLLNNYFLDAFTIPLSRIPLLGGVGLKNFQQIARQTNTNIYIPDLLPNLYNSKIFANNQDMRLLFTAKNVTELLLCKCILSKLIASQTQLITKSVSMSKYKLDSIILNHQSELINLMLKHSVFIQFPSLGEANENADTIIIQGQNLEAIDDCINGINIIASQYYTISGSKTQNIKDLYHTCQYRKSCQLIIDGKHQRFEIMGHCNEIKALLTSSMMNTAGAPLNLSIELNNDQKEFISGKKNGKLIKILNQLNNLPIIKFTNHDEYSFHIEISAQNSLVLKNTVELIELELPAELKFNIPEVFHKSVIGNGGSIIQQIMKKYNVFIKFSSNFDSSTNLYCLRREPNVLIKCPRKNMQNIPLVKNEIDQLVLKYSMNDILQQQHTTVYYNIKFQILKNHYSLLVNNNKLHLINKLEHDYNSFINFPSTIEDFKANSVEFNIKGSESKIKSCAKQLSSLLPQCYEFKFTANQSKFKEYFKTRDFEDQVVIPFRLLLSYDLIVNETPINSNPNSTYHQIIMTYYDSSKLPQAIESMTYWLRERGFLITEKSEMQFNPILESTVSSPIKVNKFTSTPLSMPLQSITNINFTFSSPVKKTHLPAISPGKQIAAMSPGKQIQIPAMSPSKQYMVSPSRQQLMMQSPVRPFNSTSSFSSPVKSGHYQSPVMLSPVKFKLDAINLNEAGSYVCNI